MSPNAQVNARPDFVPFPVLIGDIGGTNARFGLMQDAHAEPSFFPIVQTSAYKTIEDAIQETALDRTAILPRSAILAVAGPVTGDRISLTNCPWVVEAYKLIEEFGLETVIVLNDFEALALSLPALVDEDLEKIGDGDRSMNGTKLVIGPGTGLGASALVFARKTWVPLPGEGGHINFGPVTDHDAEIWRAMEPTNGRITAESFLSGPGISRLYKAICKVNGVDSRFTKAADITKAALQKGDETAGETLRMFATYLGRVAGDMALFTMSKGGVYLAGGIAPKIASILKEGDFRAAFEDKAPHDDLLRTIATNIITHPLPALAGIASYARTPPAFALELQGRRWQSTDR